MSSATDTTHRERFEIQPHDLGAEEAVIGSMLVGGGAVIDEVSANLPVHAFFHPVHQSVYSAMLSAHAGGIPVDIITLGDALNDAGMLENLGGRAALTEWFVKVPSAAAAEYYADIVREKFLARRMIEAATDVIKQAQDPAGEVQAKIDDAQRVFTDLALSLSKRDTVLRPSSETAPAAYAEIKAVYDGKGSTRGLSTGFHAIDRMTGGLKGGDLMIAAGRPAMGKSSFAMNIAEHVALELKKPVLVFSLEMSWMQLMTRALLSRSRVAVQAARDGMAMKEADLEKLAKARDEYAAAGLHIDDTSGLRLFEVVARSRRARTTLGVELILIDYLQLMEGGKPNGRESRAQELSEIANGIKKLARELGIPVIALAQVSRKAEDRPGAKPRLSDLKESGSIEEAADQVIFLWRPEYYEKDEARKRELEGQAWMLFEKHRNGPTNDLPVTFLKDITRFENPPDEKLYSNNPEHRQANRKS